MRSLIAALFSALAALAVPAAVAQDASFPPTMKIIVPFGAGSGTDAFARAVRGAPA